MKTSVAILLMGTTMTLGALAECPELTNKQIMDTVCGDRGGSVDTKAGVLFPLSPQKGLCVKAESPDKVFPGTPKPQRQCVYTMVSTWSQYFPFNTLTLFSTEGDPKGACPDLSFGAAALFTENPDRAFDATADTNTPENWYLAPGDKENFLAARNNFPAENLASSVIDLTPADRVLKGQRVEGAATACTYGTQTFGVIAPKAASSPP